MAAPDPEEGAEAEGSRQSWGEAVAAGQILLRTMKAVEEDKRMVAVEAAPAH